VFVNHIPSWHHDFEFEREVQTVAAAALVDEMLDGRAADVILAGDLDAEPTSASVRFLSGQQSLAGTSVRYRDTWAGDHFGVTAELSAVLRDGRPVP
jgi:endonuclease/exonuclease/phosphatase family metal-dependent hydrolase